MDWIDRLNAAIDAIEENLTGEIRPEHLARIACCSSYHFQRMFNCMAGVPLSEYLRRRRMSRAAVDLQSGEKIVDVALKYGYASPTAFNRAFQAVHGVAPSAVKVRRAGTAPGGQAGVPVKSYPPLRFQLIVKGVEEMEYRIEARPAFRIVGISRPLDREMEKNFAVVPTLWQTAAADGTIPALAGMMDTQPMGLLGVCACGNDEAWRYFIAVASTRPAGQFEEYTVPAATWAIFSGRGTNLSIQELERRAITEWLPTSGYEYGDAPDVEVYLNPDPENAVFEVWIPVVKK